MKIKNKIKLSYEPEADVLMWEISDKPIDYAKEVGDVIVHFTKNNIPVLIEVLEARKFLSKAKHLVGENKIAFRRQSPVAAG
ncbi:hypothetical protein A2Y83_01470 [Candidatus Falkowbacteria bacterium RBG_13_39_14]|uniref:DUF2283 domain-containing protein n=1 Tax=Candidatus Falkowbacteria bacterium RBG_13_39_14 TaxID=1797985 RepID=A0A1F5S1T7_9BACT|nr:MAG: hypothetical protein A2Y83_01470 [Candidatus Falkowbacteria bacterium RBG_13_39_14]